MAEGIATKAQGALDKHKWLILGGGGAVVAAFAYLHSRSSSSSAGGTFVPSSPGSVGPKGARGSPGPRGAPGRVKVPKHFRTELRHLKREVHGLQKGRVQTAKVADVRRGVSVMLPGPKVAP